MTLGYQLKSLGSEPHGSWDSVFVFVLFVFLALPCIVVNQFNRQLFTKMELNSDGYLLKHEVQGKFPTLSMTHWVNDCYYLVYTAHITKKKVFSVNIS